MDVTRTKSTMYAIRGLGSKSTQQRIGRVIAYLLVLVGSFLMLIPLVWLLRSSVMTIRQIFTFPPQWIPDPLQLSNYPKAFTTVPFITYFFNTMKILVPVVLGTTITASLSAYSFSRLRWPGRDLIFAALLTTLMLPYTVTLIPTFLLWARLGQVNTIVPLVLPHWFGGGIFYIFLLRQFFRSIPIELDEAAIIDGANPLQIIWYVIVPLSRPALITVAIFSGLGAWNDFLGPLIYLNSSDNYTLALGLSQFTGMYRSEWHLLMAASAMVVAPVLVLFFVAQSYFVEGITLTGIKG
jgi:multiple sugar transport system permease protein